MNIIILGLLVLLGQETNAAVISLEQIKEIAAKKSYQVKGAKTNVEYFKNREEELNAKFLPKLGIELGYERLYDNTNNQIENRNMLYGEVNLFKGGADQIELGQGKLDSEKSQSLLQQTKFDQNIYLEDLFYRYLYFVKLVKLNREDIQRNKVHLRLIKRRLKANLISDADYLEFKLRGLKLQAQRKYRVLKIQEIKNELLSVARVEKPLLVEISGNLPHFILVDSLAELYLKIKDGQTLKQHRLNIAHGALEYQKVRSAWFPKVDLQVKTGNISEFEHGSLVALNAKWEFFSGGKTRSIMNGVRLQQRTNEYSLQQYLLESRVQVSRFYSELKNLESLIDLEEKNDEIARLLYSKVLKEYKKGVKDSGALSATSDELSGIKKRIYDLKAEYIAIKLQLEKTLGSSVKFVIREH